MFHQVSNYLFGLDDRAARQVKRLRRPERVFRRDEVVTLQVEEMSWRKIRANDNVRVHRSSMPVNTARKTLGVSSPAGDAKTKY